jgi:hypothetical protein
MSTMDFDFKGYYGYFLRVIRKTSDVSLDKGFSMLG